MDYYLLYCIFKLGLLEYTYWSQCRFKTSVKMDKDRKLMEKIHAYDCRDERCKVFVF